MDIRGFATVEKLGNDKREYTIGNWKRQFSQRDFSKA